MKRPTRRQFQKSLLGIPMAAAGLPEAAQAQESKPNSPVQAVEALTETVRILFQPELTPEEWKKVRQRIGSGLFAAQALQQLPITNADEPAFLFGPDLFVAQE